MVEYMWELEKTVKELREENARLKAENERLHEENFWLTGDRAGRCPAPTVKDKEENQMEERREEMTQEREAAILEGAIEKFGVRPQVIVAIEELAELQKELTKWLRGKGKAESLREEMADVSIMLNQLELIFGSPVEEEIAKLERLDELMKDLGMGGDKEAPKND